MREKTQKTLALLLVFVLVSSVCLLFACRKQGMFIDEIYTYGLSNSSYRPFLGGLKYSSIPQGVFPRGEFLDYVSITGDEGFDFASVYYNQVNDVHPPLYYWLFNIASTLSRGSYSKWTGLTLDWILYMLCLVMLYKLVRKLGGSWQNGCAAALLYGLCQIGLSTMLMIRMYVLLTLLTLVLAWFIACLMQEFRRSTCVFIGLTLLAGMMTQYYFVFYAFFLCAAYVIWALVKKQYRAMAWFIPCALIGALALLAVFPAALNHLFSGELVSGESAVDNLKNFAQYPARLRTFVGQARHGLRAPILAALAAVVLLAVRCRGFLAACREKAFYGGWLVFILPAFVTFFLVAVISPVDEPRYIYNLMPFFVLAVSFLFCLLEGSLGTLRRPDAVKAAALLCVAALALWEARCVPPDYLYPEHARYNAVLAEHGDDPCVFFAEPEWAFVPMTEDLNQLILFPEVYVTDDKSLDGFETYVAGADEVVVYIDVSEFWSSGYDAQAILDRLAAEAGYPRSQLLFTTGLSETYLISK